MRTSLVSGVVVPVFQCVDHRRTHVFLNTQRIWIIEEPMSSWSKVVAHDCGYPLSRYTCRATRVAADFLEFRAFCRCSTGVALRPLKILVSHLPPPVPGGVAPKFGSEKVSRYTGVSQLQLRVSRCTVQLSRILDIQCMDLPKLHVSWVFGAGIFKAPTFCNVSSKGHLVTAGFLYRACAETALNFREKFRVFSQNDFGKISQGWIPKPQFWYPPLRFGSQHRIPKHLFF